MCPRFKRVYTKSFSLIITLENWQRKENNLLNCKACYLLSVLLIRVFFFFLCFVGIGKNGVIEIVYVGILTFRRYATYQNVCKEFILDTQQVEHTSCLAEFLFVQYRILYIPITYYLQMRIYNIYISVLLFLNVFFYWNDNILLLDSFKFLYNHITYLVVKVLISL